MVVAVESDDVMPVRVAGGLAMGESGSVRMGVRSSAQLTVCCYRRCMYHSFIYRSIMAAAFGSVNVWQPASPVHSLSPVCLSALPATAIACPSSSHVPFHPYAISGCCSAVVPWPYSVLTKSAATTLSLLDCLLLAGWPAE